jgi:hypothetical protein
VRAPQAHAGGQRFHHRAADPAGRHNAQADARDGFVAVNQIVCFQDWQNLAGNVGEVVNADRDGLVLAAKVAGAGDAAFLVFKV